MSKAKGSRAERKTIRVLEGWGFVCTKAGGSLGAFDIIGIAPDEIRCVQVKAGKNPRLSRLERSAIAAIRVPDNCVKELWIWKDYARGPSVEVLA